MRRPQTRSLSHREPTPTDLTTAVSLLRTTIGVAMLAAPSLLPRMLGADRLTARRVGYLARMVGWREIALGAGTLAGVHEDGDPRPWLAAQACSDAGDAVSLLTAARRGHVHRGLAAMVTLFAAGGLAFDVFVLDRLRRVG